MPYRDSQKRKEYQQKWREEHKEYFRKYREEHPDYWKNYCKEHPNYQKNHYKKYSEKIKENYKKWVREHPDYKKNYWKEHKKELTRVNGRWQRNHPEATKRYRARRRQFGFIPLNEPFEGCEAHHIDKERVIYIPKEIHRSVWHSQVSGVGMEKINKLAFDYLKNEMGERAILMSCG